MVSLSLFSLKTNRLNEVTVCCWGCCRFCFPTLVGFVFEFHAVVLFYVNSLSFPFCLLATWLSFTYRLADDDNDDGDNDGKENQRAAMVMMKTTLMVPITARMKAASFDNHC